MIKWHSGDIKTWAMALLVYGEVGMCLVCLVQGDTNTHTHTHGPAAGRGTHRLSTVTAMCPLPGGE